MMARLPLAKAGEPVPTAPYARPGLRIDASGAFLFAHHWSAMYTGLSIAFAILAQMNARYSEMRSSFDQEAVMKLTAVPELV
jgi:hypothetical protein